MDTGARLSPSLRGLSAGDSAAALLVISPWCPEVDSWLRFCATIPEEWSSAMLAPTARLRDAGNVTFFLSSVLAGALSAPRTRRERFMIAERRNPPPLSALLPTYG